jgi:hypothetical protein
MSLANLVQRGPSRQPLRIVLYGVEGIGKSTFAADAPAPIFIGPEDGFGDLEVPRLPAVRRWEDVTNYVELLTNDQHDFRTIVLDTLDHMERLLQDYVCQQEEVPSIEKIPYGKGFSYMADEWGRFVASLDVLRGKRSMHVLALAHAVVKPFKNPEGPDYDRYILRMNEKAAALWKEWCDVLLFANYDVTVLQDDKTAKKEKAVLQKGKARSSTARRVIHTTRSAAFDAKNRYDLPDKLELDFAEFADAVKLGQRGAPRPDPLRAAIGDAMKSGRWSQEQVAALLRSRGAEKAADVAPEVAPVIIAALAGTPPAPAPATETPSNPAPAPAPAAPAAPAPAAPTVVPTTAEHESWATAKDGFLAALANLKVDILELSAFCGAKGKPAPHCLADRSRAALLEQLRDAAIREKYDAWVAEHRERQAIQGEPSSAAAK